MKKHTCNYLVLFVICFFIQTKYTAQATLPVFMHPEKSKIIHAKDSALWMGFYKKLNSLQEGKLNRINIAHFGGSHIQAGFWSNVLMDGFNKLGNFEGGGLYIFPFKIVKSNTPSFYRSFGEGKWKRCRCAITREMCEKLGLSGMAAVTNDSIAAFGFKLLETCRPKKINSVKVYHNFNSSFELSIKNSTELKFKRNDNLLKGYTEFVFEAELDSLYFSVLKKDTLAKDFILRGISAENNKPGIYYASIGVNGASSSSFLRCSEFVNELKNIPPDMVIFSLGVNDTHDVNFSKQKFISNYDSLTNIIKSVSPNCAFLFVTTTDNYLNRKTSNKRPIKAAEAAYELAEKHKGAVYDLYAVMGGYRSIYKWYKVGLAARDKVHFNSRGYKIIGNLMYDAIHKNYLENTKKK